MGFLNNRIFPTISIVAGIFTLIYFCAYQYYLINFPYQLEYREGAICNVVSILQSGSNFYDYQFHPQSTYVYGIGYPIVVYLGSFFSHNILQTARIISSIFMFGTIISVFIILIKRGSSYSSASAASALLMPAMVYYANLGFPHAMVTFLMVLAISIPYWYKFSYRTVFISLAISVFAFLSKPYGLIMGGVLITYLFLFESKKKALVGGLFFIFLSCSAVLLIHLFFESYFTDTFFSFICVPYLSVFSHAINQLKDFFGSNYFFMITIIIYTYHLSINYSIGDIRSISCGIKVLDEPFFKKLKIDYFGFVAFVSFLLFLFKLGHHVGTSGGLYLYHIFFPFFLIWMVQVDRLLYKPFLRNIIWLIYISLGVFTFYNFYIYHYFHFKDLTDKYKPVVERVLKYRFIYGSQSFTNILVDHNRQIFNSGQSEYFSDAAQCLDKAEQIQFAYNQRISAMIAKNKFDLVLKTKDDYGSNAINSDTLKKYYQNQENHEFMGRSIEFWVVK